MYTHRRALLGCVAISPSNWHKLAARTHPCFTWETSIGPIRRTQHALPRQLDALNRDCKLDLLFFEDWFQSRRIHLNVRTREFKWNRQVSNFILLQLVRRREFNLQLCVEVLRIKILVTLLISSMYSDLRTWLGIGSGIEGFTSLLEPEGSRVSDKSAIS